MCLWVSHCGAIPRKADHRIRTKNPTMHKGNREDVRLGRSLPAHPALPDKEPLTESETAVDIPLCLLPSCWALLKGMIRDTMNN